MKTNRIIKSTTLQLENQEKSNKTNKSQNLYIKNSLFKKNKDKNICSEFKLKENSEDILTSFKTKTNRFNSNFQEFCSICSLDDNSLDDSYIDYFKKRYNKPKISESSSEDCIYNNDEYGAYFKFGIENNDNSILNYLHLDSRHKKTEKMDCKYYTNFIDAKKVNEFLEKNKILKKNYCWLATYDKLIKRKKILKILKFYGNPIDESKIIEKCLKIDNFDLFYNYNYDKPLIKPGKNFILVKLYLLDYEQFNIIFKYLNRVNAKLNINEINSCKNNDIHKGKYDSLFSDIKYYPYPLLYFLGNYLNINIFSFSNYSYDDLNNSNIDINNNINKSLNNKQFQKIPSSNKISKFIKVLMLNFPEQQYNLHFFIFYSIANLKFINFNQKYLEISKIITSYNIKTKIKQIKNKKEIELSNNKSNNYTKSSQNLKDKMSSLEEKKSNIISLNNSQNSKMINTNLDSLNTDSSYISSTLSKSFYENIYLKNNNKPIKNEKNKSCIKSNQNIINNSLIINKYNTNEKAGTNKKSKLGKIDEINNNNFNYLNKTIKANKTNKKFFKTINDILYKKNKNTKKESNFFFKNKKSSYSVNLLDKKVK